MDFPSMAEQIAAVATADLRLALYQSAGGTHHVVPGRAQSGALKGVPGGDELLDAASKLGRSFRPWREAS